MESLGVRCGNLISFNGSKARTTRKRWMEEKSWNNCFKIKNLKPMQIQITTQACLTQDLHENTIDRRKKNNNTIASIPFFQKQEICIWEQHNNNNKISPEKLDEWIHDSVTEIVRNIGEAPFLVHLYAPPATRLVEMEREKAMPDSWQTIRKRWEEGCPIPDGVILVEQLDQQKQKQLVLEIDDDYSSNKQEVDEDPTTRSWGVLVQGRGIDKASCYILKTCRVWSSLGFCTHFCLIKAKCFGDTAELQLQNSWNGIGNGGISG
ncbi:hypothetical protein AQUCO_02400058v1 [Aquilegia coerulea]|uniref:DUF7804 domain-containing protein n=1 Tax=Aquilegia coerulea TaxID=218851 RepID=A0A2G5DB23_AQUCA|nr:hypothetical protein AQUCO_02400058v1 [Aquilegia coerulea]